MLLSFLVTHKAFNYVKGDNIRFECLYALRTFLSFSQVIARARQCFVNFIINDIVTVLIQLSGTFRLLFFSVFGHTTKEMTSMTFISSSSRSSTCTMSDGIKQCVLNKACSLKVILQCIQIRKLTEESLLISHILKSVQDSQQAKGKSYKRKTKKRLTKTNSPFPTDHLESSL